MKTLIRLGLAGSLCVGVAGAVGLALLNPSVVDAIGSAFRPDRGRFVPDEAPATPVVPVATPADMPAPPAPGAPPTIPLFGSGGFENAGYGTAARFTGEVADRGSIEELRAAYESRARRGIEACLAEIAAIPPDAPEAPLRTIRAMGAVILLHMYEGRFAEAATWAEKAIAAAGGAPPGLRANLVALLGVIHLRRGESENCLDCRGPSSCIFPIAGEAFHRKPSGSREAIRHFTAYLAERPDDAGVRWLLNVAYMTLDEYPDKVPPGYRIDLAPFRSKLDLGVFPNVAADAGLNARGPNMAGGSVFDDFTGDGLPDVFTASFDVGLGASFFVNRGDGTFEDRSDRPVLKAQPLAINCTQADFDNDGRLDVLILRGGWENAARMTLLRNLGDGDFEDVTLAAGLGEPIASHSAAWGDFDNDGLVDVFVCGEFAATGEDGLFAGDGSLMLGDARNRCRLYRNKGDGTFEDVADRAGVRNDLYAKGAAWGDYDDDGRVDLYVSNFLGPNRLYRNNGDGTFTDRAPRLGVTGPLASFACGFWDYDNDGRLDLFVIDYAGDLSDYVASMLGLPSAVTSHPRLFRNLGPAGFRDASRDVGLDKVVEGMGLGVGDVDNDGFLDVYAGTGRPGYSALMPNVLLKNVEGRRFEDVTASTGTGHLQKGHGISFADYDLDGDLDLFAEVGGAVPGDSANNLLFRNPGHGRHWLRVELVGRRSNRSALGARVRVDLKRPDGTIRSVHRQVGNSTSYGGSALAETIGLGDASAIESLTVTWPAGRASQTFRDVAPDRAVRVVEGEPSLTVLATPTRRRP